MKPTQQAFTFGEQPIRPPATARPNKVIEASAGTGKTTAIVGEVLNLMLEREDLAPERIVLMTFTEKAAGEIADRIRTALESLSAALDEDDGRPVCWPEGSDSPLVTVTDRARARPLIARQVANLDSLRSQTIHSFCQSLLRSFPIEAGLDPQFRIIQGFERALLYGQVYDQWLDAETRLDPQPDVVAEWELLFAHVGYLFFIRDLILGLIERRDLLGETDVDFGGTADFADRMTELVATVRSSDEQPKDRRAVRMFDHLRENDPPGREATVEQWIEYFAPIAGAIRELDLPRTGTPVLKEAQKALRAGDKGDSIHDRLTSHRAAMAMIALSRRFASWLDAEKRKIGVADFDDLLLRTRALLDDPAVLERARAQFDYIFVDEFQDTDRTQAAIVRKLVTGPDGAFVPGRLVVVGDPKQSIYGFRRADPETYHAMTTEILRSGGIEVPIRRQYRSDAPLVASVNAMFGRLFAGQPEDPNVFRPKYSAVEAARTRPQRELDARFTLLGVEPAGKAERFVAEAEAIADWIEANRERDRRDLRRFAILFRRLTHLDDYLDTLQRRGIDYALPPTRLFLDRPAAVDLLAVLRAVGFSFDRGAQVSAARSPCFALTDVEIAEGICGAVAESHPWRRFEQAMERFREASRHLSVSALVERVISTCGIEDLYRAAADGIRHLRHLEHLRAIAFEFDQRTGGSVRTFVEEIQSRREEPDEMEPALADETQNAVRILSVHAAKGLEFETVILPDLAFRGGSGEATKIYTVEEPRSMVLTGRADSISANLRYTREDEPLRNVGGMRETAEMRRLFYVAVTRAITDVVFVCNLHPKTQNAGFLSCLLEGLAIDRRELAELFPAAGREIREVPPIGNVGFERPPAARTAGTEGARLRPRLADRSLEEAVAAAPLAAAALELPDAIETLTRSEAAARRAAGRSRAAGILLHRLLELWDGTSDPGTLLQQVAAEAGADRDTAGLVRRRLETVAASPALRRIRSAQTLGRELTIRFEEDGQPAERRIDRLVREDGRLLVVDYKSGSAGEDRLAKDRLQVARYCEAVTRLSGEPCSGLLWYIGLESDDLFEVTAAAADRAAPRPDGVLP